MESKNKNFKLGTMRELRVDLVDISKTDLIPPHQRYLFERKGHFQFNKLQTKTSNSKRGRRKRKVIETPESSIHSFLIPTVVDNGREMQNDNLQRYPHSSDLEDSPIISRLRKTRRRSQRTVDYTGFSSDNHVLWKQNSFNKDELKKKQYRNLIETKPLKRTKRRRIMVIDDSDEDTSTVACEEKGGQDTLDTCILDRDDHTITTNKESSELKETGNSHSKTNSVIKPLSEISSEINNNEYKDDVLFKNKVLEIHAEENCDCKALSSNNNEYDKSDHTEGDITVEVKEISDMNVVSEGSKNHCGFKLKRQLPKIIKDEKVHILKEDISCKKGMWNKEKCIAYDRLVSQNLQKTLELELENKSDAKSSTTAHPNTEEDASVESVCCESDKIIEDLKSDLNTQVHHANNDQKCSTLSQEIVRDSNPMTQGNVLDTILADESTYHTSPNMCKEEDKTALDNTFRNALPRNFSNGRCCKPSLHKKDTYHLQQTERGPKLKRKHDINETPTSSKIIRLHRGPLVKQFMSHVEKQGPHKDFKDAQTEQDALASRTRENDIKCSETVTELQEPLDTPNSHNMEGTVLHNAQLVATDGMPPPQIASASNSELNNNGIKPSKELEYYNKKKFADIDKNQSILKSLKNTVPYTNVKGTSAIEKTANLHEDNSEDDDAISLYADSILEESPCRYVSPNNMHKSCLDKPYVMSATTIERFVESSIDECNKELDSLAKKYNETPTVQSLKNLTYTDATELVQPDKHMVVLDRVNKKIAERAKQNIQNIVVRDSNGEKNNMIQNAVPSVDLTSIFRGYCFDSLRCGPNCTRYRCKYSHRLINLIQVFSTDQWNLIDVLMYTLAHKWFYITEQMYTRLVHRLNTTHILQMYEKFYRYSFITMDIVSKTVQELLNKKLPLEDIVNSLTKIACSDNTDVLNYILQATERHIQHGQYWNTIKMFFPKLKCQKAVVEKILEECLSIPKDCCHIEEVQKNVMAHLHFSQIKALDRNKVSPFINLLVSCRKETSNTSMPATLQNNKNTVTIETIASPDSRQDDRTEQEMQFSCTKDLDLLLSNCKSSSVIGSKDIDQRIDRDLQSNSNGSNSYQLQHIDNLPEPHSQYSDTYWKFNLKVQSLVEGLKHNDYDHVIGILDEEANEKDKSLFAFSCYQILRSKVKQTQYHLINIIKRTVHCGRTIVLRKILCDVAKYILIALVNEGAWILAYNLLKFLYIFETSHDAAFVMLGAEIHLANKRCLKAYSLLKQENIINTNRATWHVSNNEKDEFLRVNVMNILLDSLCRENVEHAFLLFQFLCKDQPQIYAPIDLSCHVNKITLALLRKKSTDLIVIMAGLIIGHEFAVDASLFRAVIVTLVNCNMVSAEQLYQYAIGLGVYNSLQFHPVTHMIINLDWTEEEVFLIFKELLKELAKSIGPGIDRMNHRQLSIHLFFENIPADEELYHDKEWGEQSNYKAIVNSKRLVKSVLQRRFDPPIHIMKNVHGKTCKLQSSSVINHLMSKNCV